MIFRKLFLNKISPKLTIFSNIFSGVWSAILGILFVPVYLRYVGVEAYGIIGFFTSLQVFLYILDFGLSPTFNREIARLSAAADPETNGQIRTLTKTLGRVNWIVTLIIGFILAVLSPLLANYWVKVENLSVRTVTECFLIMSLSTMLQFPASLYTGGLLGLQRQMTSNLINVTSGTLRALGSVFVLAFISPTIQAFLIWQAVVSLAQTSVTAVAFHKSVPGAPVKARFDRKLIAHLWQFAVGNTAITFVALILMQMDKIVLSKMISLEDFGYYSLATTISSMSLVMLVSSVSTVAYTQFSRLVAQNDALNLIKTYHQNSQLVAVLIIPVALNLAFFSREVLYLWTRNDAIADRSSLLLTLSAVGTGLHCLMWIPHYMQLAHGWTKLSFYKDLIAIFIFAPLLFLLVSRFGALGGPLGWAILSFSNFTVYIWLMHRRILQGELSSWYFWDVGMPLFSTLLVVICGRLLLGDTRSLPVIFITLALVGLLSLAAAALSAYSIRQAIFQFVSRRFSAKGQPVEF